MAIRAAVNKDFACNPQVEVHEAKDTVGGACKTEYPFKKAPGLGTSTGEAPLADCMLVPQQKLNLTQAVSQDVLLCCAGAYLLGVMPPELLKVHHCSFSCSCDNTAAALQQSLFLQTNCLSAA